MLADNGVGSVMPKERLERHETESWIERIELSLAILIQLSMLS